MTLLDFKVTLLDHRMTAGAEWTWQNCSYYELLFFLFILPFKYLVGESDLFRGESINWKVFSTWKYKKNESISRFRFLVEPFYWELIILRGNCWSNLVTCQKIVQIMTFYQSLNFSTLYCLFSHAANEARYIWSM